MTDTRQTLKRLAISAVAAEHILATVAEAGLISELSFGMVMAPQRFDLLAIQDGKVQTHDSADADPLFANAYEIRLFGKTTDASWQRSGLTGTLTILTVADIIGGEPVEGQTGETLDRSYRLFGKADQSPHNKDWSIAKSGRVRPIPVPLALVTARQNLKLTAIEHIGVLDHGNAAVIAERLTGIAVLADKESTQ